MIQCNQAFSPPLPLSILPDGGKASHSIIAVLLTSRLISPRDCVIHLVRVDNALPSAVDRKWTIATLATAITSPIWAEHKAQLGNDGFIKQGSAPDSLLHPARKC